MVTCVQYIINTYTIFERINLTLVPSGLYFVLCVFLPKEYVVVGRKYPPSWIGMLFFYCLRYLK